MADQSIRMVWFVDVSPNLFSPLRAPRCFTSDTAAKRCRDEYAEQLAKRVHGMVQKVPGTLSLEVVSGTSPKAYCHFTVTVRMYELEAE